ncbi:alpha/beta hydrolase [Nocardia sp. XZ_19_385]|uniref:alpha/beta hydrolase n=1 Tax=Nocardia sp. XZ_19_385 TaxID=2769488 RepID=UPI00189093FB|nr:alpha/beta hydrolase [Nocardia sp. XZ_19_385]
MTTEIVSTPAQSEPRPTNPDRPTRSVGIRILRFLGLFIAWTLCLATILAGLVFFAPRIPGRAPQDVVSIAALIVPWLTAPLLVMLLLTVLIVAAAWYSGRRILLTAGALAIVLGLLLIITPWWSARGTAATHGAALSWSEFFHTPAAPSPTETRTYQRIENQDLAADIYRPQRLAPSRPALLYVHGGGWNSGTRADSAPWFEWLAQQGITVFSIDYRLAPPPRWQDAVGDVKCALGWIRANAADYSIAPSNVSIAGDSAGGQLAMMAAYTIGDQQFPPSCAVPEAPVRSVMGWYAPTDLPALITHTRMPNSLENYLQDYLGSDLETQRARVEQISPINHVRPGLPPTLLIQGGIDRMIPDTQAPALADRLHAMNVPAEAVVIPWADHNFTGQWGSWGSQILRPVALDFLQKYAINVN